MNAPASSHPLGSSLSAHSPLAEKARALVPLADSYGEYSDTEGRINDAVVQRLHDDGLLNMWVPKILGGFELGPTDSLEVIENLSYGDASAGWVLMAACLSIGTAGSFLGDDAVAELFAAGNRPVIAGQGTRPGVARPTDGGYLVSGSWSFASGLLHGTHIHTLAIIETTGEPRIFVVPVDKAELLGNWDVMGLRGTGSIDYRLTDVFVPESYTHFAVLDTAQRGGSLYNLGIIGFAEICHSGWALGVGRRLLDELAALTREKAGRPCTQTDNAAFLEGFAKAEGHFRAARAFVYEAWTDVARTLDAGGHPDVRQHTLIRLALANVTQTLHEVAQHVYLAAGTTALRRGTLQRFVRDVHAGTQHVTSSPAVVQNIGRELLGTSPDHHWIFLDLVPA
jgi:alkylation response protein AidB-like acyl-CoA dehydrogenase